MEEFRGDLSHLKTGLFTLVSGEIRSEMAMGRKFGQMDQGMKDFG